MLLVGESALCEWRFLFLDSPGEDFVGIQTQIKAAGRKLASTKQFIKGKVQSQGGRVGRSRKVELAVGCLRIGYLLQSLWAGMVSNAGCLSHLGDSSHRL